MAHVAQYYRRRSERFLDPWLFEKRPCPVLANLTLIMDHTSSEYYAKLIQLYSLYKTKFKSKFT